MSADDPGARIEEIEAFHWSEKKLSTDPDILRDQVRSAHAIKDLLAIVHRRDSRTLDPTNTNPHAANCPSCDAAICLRCIALFKRMDPDGLDGCDACERGVKRTQKALDAHIAKDHS